MNKLLIATTALLALSLIASADTTCCTTSHHFLARMGEELCMISVPGLPSPVLGVYLPTGDLIFFPSDSPGDLGKFFSTTPISAIKVTYVGGAKLTSFSPPTVLGRLANPPGDLISLEICWEPQLEVQMCAPPIAKFNEKYTWVVQPVVGGGDCGVQGEVCGAVTVNFMGFFTVSRTSQIQDLSLVGDFNVLNPDCECPAQVSEIKVKVGGQDIGATIHCDIDSLLIPANGVLKCHFSATPALGAQEHGDILIKVVTIPTAGCAVAGASIKQFFEWERTPVDECLQLLVKDADGAVLYSGEICDPDLPLPVISGSVTISSMDQTLVFTVQDQPINVKVCAEGKGEVSVDISEISARHDTLITWEGALLPPQDCLALTNGHAVVDLTDYFSLSHSASDINYQVSAKVLITNDDNLCDAMIEGVTVSIGSIVCPDLTSLPFALAPGQVIECTVTYHSDDLPAGPLVVTVQLAVGSLVTPPAPAPIDLPPWTVNVIHDCMKIRLPDGSEFPHCLDDQMPHIMIDKVVQNPGMENCFDFVIVLHDGDEILWTSEVLTICFCAECHGAVGVVIDQVCARHDTIFTWDGAVVPPEECLPLVNGKGVVDLSHYFSIDFSEADKNFHLTARVVITNNDPFCNAQILPPVIVTMGGHQVPELTISCEDMTLPLVPHGYYVCTVHYDSDSLPSGQIVVTVLLADGSLVDTPAPQILEVPDWTVTVIHGCVDITTPAGHVEYCHGDGALPALDICEVITNPGVENCKSYTIILKDGLEELWSSDPLPICWCPECHGSVVLEAQNVQAGNELEVTWGGGVIPPPTCLPLVGGMAKVDLSEYMHVTHCEAAKNYLITFDLKVKNEDDFCNAVVKCVKVLMGGVQVPELTIVCPDMTQSGVTLGPNDYMMCTVRYEADVPPSGQITVVATLETGSLVQPPVALPITLPNWLVTVVHGCVDIKDADGLLLHYCYTQGALPEIIVMENVINPREDTCVAYQISLYDGQEILKSFESLPICWCAECIGEVEMHSECVSAHHDTVVTWGGAIVPPIDCLPLVDGKATVDLSQYFDVTTSHACNNYVFVATVDIKNTDCKCAVDIVSIKVTMGGLQVPELTIQCPADMNLAPNEVIHCTVRYESNVPPSGPIVVTATLPPGSLVLPPDPITIPVPAWTVTVINECIKIVVSDGTSVDYCDGQIMPQIIVHKDSLNTGGQTCVSYTITIKANGVPLWTSGPLQVCWCFSGCSYTLGYWQTHAASYWPPHHRPSDRFINSTYQTTLGWQEALRQSSRVCYWRFAQQWIAAVLNNDNGAVYASSTKAAVDLLGTLLCNYASNPAGLKCTSLPPKYEAAYSLLGNFNEGKAEVPHC